MLREKHPRSARREKHPASARTKDSEKNGRVWGVRPTHVHFFRVIYRDFESLLSNITNR